MLGWLRKAVSRDNRETRSTGFTAEVIAARDAYIAGESGLAELTAAAQGCVSLWEGALAQARVRGTERLTADMLALTARSLALRGEAVFLIRDRLIPVTDWTLTTRLGVPTAYQVTIAEAGGGRTVTALADEVIHITIGADPAAPWAGVAPLRRASLSAGLLDALERSLQEVYANAPIGSQVVPYPESPDVDREQQARSFRARRGRVLLRESVNVAAAGGPTPQGDWTTSNLTPDLSRAMTREHLDQATATICWAFGVLPMMLDPKAVAGGVREGQRHLASWTLQPIAQRLAEEVTDKLEGRVEVDVMEPLQAYDAGQRARALQGTVEGLAMAKQAGLSDEQVSRVLQFAGLEAVSND